MLINRENLKIPSDMRDRLLLAARSRINITAAIMLPPELAEHYSQPIIDFYYGLKNSIHDPESLAGKASEPDSILQGRIIFPDGSDELLAVDDYEKKDFSARIAGAIKKTSVGAVEIIKKSLLGLMSDIKKQRESVLNTAERCVMMFFSNIEGIEELRIKGASLPDSINAIYLVCGRHADREEFPENVIFLENPSSLGEAEERIADLAFSNPNAKKKLKALNGKSFFLEDKTPIKFKGILGTGSEGCTFSTSYKNIAAKIFYTGRNAENKVKNMSDIIPALKGICWPEDAIYDENGNESGYIVRKAPGILLGQLVYRAEHYFPRHDFPRKEVIVAMLKTITSLNSNHFFVTDLNIGNFTVDFSWGTNIYIVDSDSISPNEEQKQNSQLPAFLWKIASSGLSPRQFGSPIGIEYRYKMLSPLAESTFLYSFSQGKSDNEKFLRSRDWLYAFGN